VPQALRGQSGHARASNPLKRPRQASMVLDRIRNRGKNEL
jgi:hypothetical protein